MVPRDGHSAALECLIFRVSVKHVERVGSERGKQRLHALKRKRCDMKLKRKFKFTREKFCESTFVLIVEVLKL